MDQGGNPPHREAAEVPDDVGALGLGPHSRRLQIQSAVSFQGQVKLFQSTNNGQFLWDTEEGGGLSLLLRSEPQVT